MSGTEEPKRLWLASTPNPLRLIWWGTSADKGPVEDEFKRLLEIQRAAVSAVPFPVSFEPVWDSDDCLPWTQYDHVPFSNGGVDATIGELLGTQPPHEWPSGVLLRRHLVPAAGEQWAWGGSFFCLSRLLPHIQPGRHVRLRPLTTPLGEVHWDLPAQIEAVIDKGAVEATVDPTLTTLRRSDGVEIRGFAVRSESKTLYVHEGFLGLMKVVDCTDFFEDDILGRHIKLMTAEFETVAVVTALAESFKPVGGAQ